MSSPVIEFSVLHYRNGKILLMGDPVIQETTLVISLNGDRLVEIACAGIHVKELALGFLQSEGLISNVKDVEDIIISESPLEIDVVTAIKENLKGGTPAIMSSGARRRRDRGVSSPLEAEPRISAQDALSLMNTLLESSVLHETTRGTHCSGLAVNGEMKVVREDIGRHNTVDMLAGYSLLNELETGDQAVVTTGRISSEIVGKVWRHGAPLIISHSAPTSKAIEMAGFAGITLIGYVRKNWMRIYTHERRVIF